MENKCIEGGGTMRKLSCLEKSKKPLHPYQEIVVRYLLNHRGIIVAHDVGAGKTLMAVAASQCLMEAYPNMITVVVTPVSLQENFKKTMDDYGISRDDDRYKFMTIDKFHRTYVDKEHCMSNVFLIIDEAHNLRTNGERTRASTAIKCSGDAKKVMLLTATPWYNNVRDIVNLVSMVKGTPQEFVLPITETNRMLSLLRNPEKADELRDYFSCIFSFHRKDIDDPNYPTLEEHDVHLEMDEHQFSQYMKVVNKQLQVSTVEKPMAFFTGVRMAANAIEPNAKIEWTLNKLRELKKDNDVIPQTVIYSTFLRFGMDIVITSYCAAENIKFGVIMGSMTKSQKTKVVNMFNNQEIQLIILSGAGREGLDLKGGRIIIIFESMWNIAGEHQVIGRLVRFGSHTHLPLEERKVDAYHLMLDSPFPWRTFNNGKLFGYIPYINGFEDVEYNKELFIKYILDKKYTYYRAIIEELLEIAEHKFKFKPYVIERIKTISTANEKDIPLLTSVFIYNYVKREPPSSYPEEQTEKKEQTEKEQKLKIEREKQINYKEEYTLFIERALNTNRIDFMKEHNLQSTYPSADTHLKFISIFKDIDIQNMISAVIPLSIENGECNVIPTFTKDDEICIPYIEGTDVKEIFDPESEIAKMHIYSKASFIKDLYIAKYTKNEFVVKGNEFPKYISELRKLGGSFVKDEEGELYKDRLSFGNISRDNIESFIFSTYSDEYKKDIAIHSWMFDRTSVILDACLVYAKTFDLRPIPLNILKKIMHDLFPFSIPQSNDVNLTYYDEIKNVLDSDSKDYLARYINEHYEMYNSLSYDEYVNLTTNMECVQKLMVDEYSGLTKTSATILSSIRHILLFFGTKSIADVLLVLLPQRYRKDMLNSIDYESLKPATSVDYIKMNVIKTNIPIGMNNIDTIMISRIIQYITALVMRKETILTRIVALSDGIGSIKKQKHPPIVIKSELIEVDEDISAFVEDAVLNILPISGALSGKTKMISKKYPISVPPEEIYLGNTYIGYSNDKYVINVYTHQLVNDVPTLENIKHAFDKLKPMLIQHTRIKSIAIPKLIHNSIYIPVLSEFATHVKLVLYKSVVKI